MVLQNSQLQQHINLIHSEVSSYWPVGGISNKCENKGRMGSKKHNPIQKRNMN